MKGGKKKKYQFPQLKRAIKGTTKKIVENARKGTVLDTGRPRGVPHKKKKPTKRPKKKLQGKVTVKM